MNDYHLTLRERTMKRGYRKDLCVEVLAFVLDYESKHGFLPTRAQIRAALDLRYRQVCYAVDTLQARGALAPLLHASHRDLCIVPDCAARVHVSRSGERYARCLMHQRVWWRQAWRRTRRSRADQKRDRFRAVLRRHRLGSW